MIKAQLAADSIDDVLSTPAPLAAKIQYKLDGGEQIQYSVTTGTLHLLSITILEFLIHQSYCHIINFNKTDF